MWKMFWGVTYLKYFQILQNSLQCLPVAQLGCFLGGPAKYVTLLKSDDTFLGGPRVCSPGNILNFGSLVRNFLHFEGTFEQNIKILNHIFNSVNKRRKSLMFILKKYFGSNLMLRNQNIKDFKYNLVYFFNIWETMICSLIVS